MEQELDDTISADSWNRNTISADSWNRNTISADSWNMEQQQHELTTRDMEKGVFREN